MKKKVKGKESIEILEIPGLIDDIEEYWKIYNHSEEKISKEFRLKNIDEIRNYLVEEINRNELISKKH